MLEKITGLPEGILGLRVVGTLTTEDYEQVIEPEIAQASEQDRRLRLLLELGERSHGFTAGVVREKTKLWMQYPAVGRWVEGYALVSDIAWVDDLFHVVGWLVPFPMRVFGTAEFDAAVDWLRSLPEGPGITHELLPDSGVLRVEVTEPLRSQDLEALAATVDAWLASHDELPGVVIHAARFPGWENVAGLLRHVAFVRDHQRRVRRVAVAADGVAADLAARLGRIFVRAEVASFGHDELDAATAWAAGAGVGRAEAATALASGDRR